MKNLEFKIGDRVKVHPEDQTWPTYATVIKVCKETLKCRDNDGFEFYAKKRIVNFD